MHRLSKCLREAAWLATAVLLAATALAAQEKPKTEAEQDQLAGPVKAVVTTVNREAVQALNSPIFTSPVWCQVCAYDPDGMWTQRGQLQDEVFSGQVGLISRDGNGRPLERHIYAAPSGELQSREIFGPNGRTESFGFSNSKLFAHETIEYNGSGRAIEWLSDDGSGKQTGRTTVRLDKDGTRLGQMTWRGENELLAEDTYNPETDDEHFIGYDEKGGMVLSWRLRSGKLLSFWQAEGSGSRYGDNFWDDLGDGKTVGFSCTDTGHCEQTAAHTEYAGGDKRNPARVERRNEAGTLVWSAEYEYVMDAHQNWTSRKVWVWTPELQSRTLYETDSRTIEYWVR
jgi:hypothetical protein